MRKGEAITKKDTWIKDAWISMLLLIIVILIAILGLIADQSIVIDKPFRVTSDTSNYSCVVSEVDENLLLDCLRTK